MYKEVGLLLLLALLEISGQVKAECRMNNEYIHKSNGTFTTYDVHGQLQLQRFNYVDEGVILEVLCQEDGKMVTHKVDCQRGRLNPVDPVTCKAPIEAKVLVTDEDHFCLATMYRIGIEIKNEFFELYRACYDKDKVRSYFSDATIYWKPIHPKLDARPFFSTDELISPAQAASFQTRNIYKTFCEIYEKSQNYVKRTEIVINRGHLTASSDMLFNDQMTSTFKLLNVVPQFESINGGIIDHSQRFVQGNWLKIEHWVGNNIPQRSVVKVRTGALGVLNLLNFKPKRIMKPAYLIFDKKQNPVPEWMYKIVRNANNQLLHVFLTYNNIFNPKKPVAHSCCKTVPCPVTLNLEDSAILGFSYCCDPEKFVQCLPHK